MDLEDSELLAHLHSIYPALIHALMDTDNYTAKGRLILAKVGRQLGVAPQVVVRQLKILKQFLVKSENC